MKSDREYQDEQDEARDFAGICFILMAMMTVVGIVYGLVRSII